MLCINIRSILYNKTAKTNVMLLKRRKPSYEKMNFYTVALAAAVAMSATACTSNPAESKTTAAPAETKARGDHSSRSFF